MAFSKSATRSDPVIFWLMDSYVTSDFSLIFSPMCLPFMKPVCYSYIILSITFFNLLAIHERSSCKLTGLLVLISMFLENVHLHLLSEVLTLCVCPLKNSSPSYESSYFWKNVLDMKENSTEIYLKLDICCVSFLPYLSNAQTLCVLLGHSCLHLDFFYAFLTFPS